MFSFFRLVQGLQNVQRDIYEAMSEIYFNDTVNEWISVNITPKLQQLQTIIQKVEKQLEVNSVSNSLNDPSQYISGSLTSN